MSIVVGTRLSSYELLAQIGAGGMGEVYKAHDTKLGRDVATKILPEAFAHDPERLSRFHREAKMLAYESAPQFSPDGHWLAYVSDESGRFEIYTQPYPGPAGKWQISTEGGSEPVWNPNGRELFYRSGNKMMAVDIATQPGFSAGKPRMLFEGPYPSLAATGPSYDVSPDRQRFLMLKGEQTPAATQINIVQNWVEELKRRVPPGK